MKKIGIFFGSSTGTTEDIANKIAAVLEVAKEDIHDVSSTDASAVQEYEVLLFGSSTWGFGELQDDWQDFLTALKQTSLSGKKVGLFGCGDSGSFDSTFCDAIGIIHEGLENSGCTFIGSYTPENYSYSESAAEVDGELIGLAIDEMNESDQTDDRINTWVTAIKSAI